MNVFIMRHGEAATIAAKDSLRPLTAEGVKQVEKMASWLAKTTDLPLKIFVSPYLRAQQTCEKVVEIVNNVTHNHEAIAETLNFITPSGNVKHTHDFIDGLFHTLKASKKHNIVLVSHMPFVSYLVAELTQSTHMPIFSTAAIAIIDYDVNKMQGELLEIVSP